MSTFIKADATRTPFGKNVWRFSVYDVKLTSYTCGAGLVPNNMTVDSVATKVLQPGVIMAKATSGVNSGKVGVFQASVADGRQTAANIVGINDTFLPWQLTERDVEIAVAYEATAKQSWCIEHDAAGAQIALSNTTRDAILALPALALLFK
jgi:hypothetical protein